MPSPDVLVYSHEWHVNRSGAFLDLVVHPLQLYANVDHQAWQDETALKVSAAPVLVFCQILPPPPWLAQQRARVVWIPMWDEVRNRPQTWWNQLPKSLRIIAFSEAVAQRARAANLPVFEIQYFKNPADFTPAKWDGQRTLFYWNRRGMISPQFLEKFCAVLKINRVLFRADIDPYVDERAHYTLPTRIGNTVVETIEVTESRDAFWKLLEPANIVIAPRLYEGAGMVFLEQMARGCAVFANDAPTMNEYIEQGINGVLFRRGWSPTRARNAILWRLAQRGLRIDAPFTFLLPERQHWDQITALDLKRLGETAREQHNAGYARWLARLPDYVRFIQGN
ncbi:MAG: glycosyltransferase [Chloroflexi bacterium]|nr:glycosyltransferase [Chloroflexota bacterium]